MGDDDAGQPVLTLDSSALTAPAGGQATVTLRVRHPGQLVDSFRVEVVGLGEGWWQAHPPVLPVYPGKEQTGVVVLTPPKGAEAPGEPLPFGVKVVSTLDPSHSAVEEGDLAVERVFDLQTSVVPVTSRARWTGRHRVTFANWGNGPVRLRLTASDPDDRLGFVVTPDQVQVPVGGSVDVRVKARPRKPFLRGAPQHLPFTLVGEAPGAERAPSGPGYVPDPNRPTVNAAVLQKPVFSAGVIALVTLLVAAVGAGVFLLLGQKAVSGATQGDVAAAAPAGITAEATAAGVIRVSWQPSDRASGYRVQPVDEAGNAIPKPADAAPGTNALDMPVTEPLVKSCFTVVALRDKLVGPAGDVACATSLDDRLAPPTSVTASRRPDGRVAVTWKGEDRDEHLVLFDGQQVGQSPAGVSESVVPAPTGEGCATVVARRGETSASVPSEEACVDAVAGAPTGGAAGGGGGGLPGGGGGATSTVAPTGGAAGAPSGWVAQVSFEYPAGDTTAAADARRAQLIAGGVANAVLIQSTVYPTLNFANPARLLVVPGFPSAAAAAQFCTANPTIGQPCAPLDLGTPTG